MAKVIGEVQKIVSTVHKSLECSICLDILDEPISTQCNHQFCRKCIDQLFDRKKGKTAVICPLCKAKISKRGLAQNRKLVNVVAAIRKVLTCIDEDITCKVVTPVAVVTKTSTGGNEVSEETPFQRSRNYGLSETKVFPEKISLSKKLTENFDDEIHKIEQLCNTRKSRKLRWSNEVEPEKTSVENTELLKTLETANLGRKTRKSKRLNPKLMEKRAPTDTFGNLPQESDITGRVDRHGGDKPLAPNRSSGTDCDDVMIQQTDASVLRLDSCEGGKDATVELAKSPTKYIVAETPMLPLQGDGTEEQLSEHHNSKSGKIVGKKKTSPFSHVNIKAPLKTRDQNVFDFVDDDPPDKSDLCERVKQRRNKEDMGPDNKLNPNINKSEGKRSRRLDQTSTAKNESLKDAITKDDGNGTRLKRPRKGSGKGHQLLKEAWDLDQEGSSQLIETASTVIDETENSTVSCGIEAPRVNLIGTDSQENLNDSAKMSSVETDAKEVSLTCAKHSTAACIENSPKGGLTASYRTEVSTTDGTVAVSISSLETALPQDNLEVSMVFEHNPDTQASLKHKDIESGRQIDILNGSDVVPPSTSSSDVPFYGPINPMESPLYKNYKKSPVLEPTNSNTYVDDALSGYTSIENQVAVASVGDQIGLQVDENKCPMSQERMSMNLYSETGSLEIKETVTAPCIKSAESSHSLVDDVQEKIKVPIDSTLKVASSSDQYMGENTVENYAYSDRDTSCNANMGKIKVTCLNEEKIGSNIAESEKVLAENKVMSEESQGCCSRASVQGLHIEQGGEGTNGEDLKEEDTSIDSTPSLCEEHYSQDTYLDDGAHGKNLKETEDSCDIQGLRGVRSECIILKHDCEVTDDPRKALMLSTGRSTEEENTQASISILAKENEGSAIDDMKTGTVLRNVESNYEKSSDGGMGLPSKVSDLGQTPKVTKVSSACQTEYNDTLDIKPQVVVDSLSTMISVACQTSQLYPDEKSSENESLQRSSRRNAHHTMSKSCQTVGTEFRNIPDEDWSLLARENNIVNMNAATLCAECKRSACRVTKNIFEIIRRNVQDAVARQGLSIANGSTHPPTNFAKSEVTIERNKNIPNVSKISEGHSNAGIRVERLNFVPVWMTANLDEGNHGNHGGISPLQSVRDIGTSKRNRLKNFINKSKKRLVLKTSVEKEGDSDTESNVDEEKSPEKSYFVACDHISNAKADNVSNVKRRGCIESRVEESGEPVQENSKDRKEMEEQITSDVTTTFSKVARPFPDSCNMIDAPLLNEDQREQSLAAQGSSFDHLDIVPSSSINTPGTAVDIVEPTPPVKGRINENRNGDFNSIDSEGEEALSLQLPQGKLANAKSIVRPLRLKRKARRQFVKGPTSDYLSKKAKLNSGSCGAPEVRDGSQELSKTGTLDSATGSSKFSDEKPTDAENAFAPICSRDMKKSFDKTADCSIIDSLQDIDSQILCDNHSGERRPREKEQRRDMIKEEKSASSRDVKADRDVCEPSFAVLQHKEDSIPDEEIAVIETSFCEQGQSQIDIDEEAFDEGDGEIEDAAPCTDYDRTSRSKMDAKNNRAIQRNEFHNSTLANPDSFANYAEDDERDLFASDVEVEECMQAEDFIQTKENLQDVKDARDIALSTDEGTLCLKGGMKDEVQDNSTGEKAEDYGTQDTCTADEANIAAITDFKDSKVLAINMDIKQDVSERACLTIDGKHVPVQVERSKDSNATIYENNKVISIAQGTKEDGENIEMDNKTVPDFMTLVKEYVNGKGNYRKEDESDEESSPMRPCFERREAEFEAQSSCSEVQDSVNTKNQIEKQADGERNVSPLSLSPPPRIKRKRTSPPEVQAALKEIKKLIRRDGNADNDDDGNMQLMENFNLRKPELQFVGDISSNNENQQRRSCSKSSDSRHQVDMPEWHHVSPNRGLLAGNRGKFSVTPRSTVQGTHKMDNNDEAIAPSLVRKSLDRGIITTPKLKEEKILSEKKPQFGNNASDPTKIKKLPQILVPSRLSKKQMIACKYLASKLDCRFSSSFIPGTSHLIMSTDETCAIDRSAYTYKYLVALITGTWIVSFQWVHACLDAGRAVSQSQFEVKGDPISSQEIVPKYARLSRQRKEPPLFHGLTLTLIGEFQASNMKKDQFVELLERGGARILFELPQKIPAKNYLLIVDLETIDDTLKAQFIEANIQPIHYEWITESIINYKIQEPLKFLLEL